MQKAEKPKIQTAMRKNWLDFINNDCRRLAIPVGPRFQVNVPDWTSPPHKHRHYSYEESDTSRWLGTRVWPMEGRRPETKSNIIGRGRLDCCHCISPGSVECVKRHVTDKRMELQFDLGPAFWRWKFDEMGEEVSNLWNLEEQKKFDSLVKMNPISQGKSFLKPALEWLPSQSRGSIVSYYFNVYIPRRMSARNRSGCTIVDTDDEAGGDASDSKACRKRCRADNVTTYSSNYVKSRYLTGRR